MVEAKLAPDPADVDVGGDTAPAADGTPTARDARDEYWSS